ncbi:hypothetical protein [Streptomyces lydicus]|uniref:hypothetical protein n=1 Tax=Streptomyces lydicus TaxID=47763 RepID=UPI0036DFCF68
MQVQIERVPSMPHNAVIFVDDRVDCYTIYILEKLIEEEPAELISAALTALVANRRRRSAHQVRSHTG